MKIFRLKTAIVAVIAISLFIYCELASAGSLPVWGGTTTTNQPSQIQQPREPLVSEPGTVPAQTVQSPEPTLRTSPGTISPPTVSTPMQQRISQPTVREGETPMSIAQDECVLYLGYTNPAYYEVGMQSGPFGTVSMPSADELAAAMAAGGPYILNYIVLEKGDYKVMYLPELILMQNLNKNNSVEVLVRLPGINMINSVHTDPDDWTKGKKSRITLRPGESTQFDSGSGATLIKVSCP